MISRLALGLGWLAIFENGKRPVPTDQGFRGGVGFMVGVGIGEMWMGSRSKTAGFWPVSRTGWAKDQTLFAGDDIVRYHHRFPAHEGMRAV